MVVSSAWEQEIAPVGAGNRNFDSWQRPSADGRLKITPALGGQQEDRGQCAMGIFYGVAQIHRLPGTGDRA